jgi:hypothetical protein
MWLADARSKANQPRNHVENSVTQWGAETSLAWQWLPAAGGDGAWAARTGSGPMLMRGDIFAASHGGGAGPVTDDRASAFPAFLLWLAGGVSWEVAVAGRAAAGAGPGRGPLPAAWRCAAVLCQ